MRRAHRRMHMLIWLVMPVVLFLILCIAFQLHGGGLGGGTS